MNVRYSSDYVCFHWSELLGWDGSDFYEPKKTPMYWNDVDWDGCPIPERHRLRKLIYAARYRIIYRERSPRITYTPAQILERCGFVKKLTTRQILERCGFEASP